jgi:metallo-beta-lactamase class B
MIDTAWTPDQTELLLSRLEPVAAGRPADLFITHFHNDRMGGLSVTAARGIASFAFASTVKEARSHDMGEIDRPLPTKLHAFDLGGRSVEAFYPGPAHTVDNAVAFDRDSGVLFGGCMMRARRATDLGNVADAYVANWAATVSLVAERYPNPDVVVPGHGDAGGRDLYDHTVALARS